VERLGGVVQKKRLLEVQWKLHLMHFQLWKQDKMGQQNDKNLRIRFIVHGCSTNSL
jgi:hypothetical protein